MRIDQQKIIFSLFSILVQTPVGIASKLHVTDKLQVVEKYERLPVARLKKDIKAYHQQLKEAGISSNYQRQETSLEVTTKLTLPSQDPEEIFNFFKSFYVLPKFVLYDDSFTGLKVTIDNPHKKSYYWLDQFSIYKDKNNKITKFEYRRRVEGGGSLYKIFRLETKRWQLEETLIAD